MSQPGRGDRVGQPGDSSARRDDSSAWRQRPPLIGLDAASAPSARARPACAEACAASHRASAAAPPGGPQSRIRCARGGAGWRRPPESSACARSALVARRRKADTGSAPACGCALAGAPTTAPGARSSPHRIIGFQAVQASQAPPAAARRHVEPDRRPRAPRSRKDRPGTAVHASPAGPGQPIRTAHRGQAVAWGTPPPTSGLGRPPPTSGLECVSGNRRRKQTPSVPRQAHHTKRAGSLLASVQRSRLRCTCFPPRDAPLAGILAVSSGRGPARGARRV
jgi:hypothetical protein